MCATNNVLHELRVLYSVCTHLRLCFFQTYEVVEIGANPAEQNSTRPPFLERNSKKTAKLTSSQSDWKVSFYAIIIFEPRRKLFSRIEVCLCVSPLVNYASISMAEFYPLLLIAILSTFDPARKIIFNPIDAINPPIREELQYF